MAKYRRRYYRKNNNDNDNDELADGLSWLFLFFLLFIAYKFHISSTTFLIGALYVVVILFLFIAVIAVIIGLKNKKIPQFKTRSLNIEDEDKAPDVVNNKSDSGVEKFFDNLKNPTKQARALHGALIKKGIKCELEKYDGFKHIDIAITWARLNIEIDGIHHYTDSKQIIADMSRAHYSQKKGYDTCRVPNFAIDKDLDGVASAIAEVARKRHYERDNKN